MIYVGIDVAKDKHDCFITNSDGEVLFKAFTISNNLDGFNELYQKIESVMEDTTKVNHNKSPLKCINAVLEPQGAPCDCNLVLNKPSCGI